MIKRKSNNRVKEVILKGSDIKKYLEANGIKQSFVAEQTGIPAPILNMMLNDNRKIEVNEYMKICDVIGVPFDYFKSQLLEKTKNR